MGEERDLSERKPGDPSSGLRDFGGNSDQIPTKREVAGTMEDAVFLEPGDENTQNIIRAISHKTAGVVVQLLSSEGPLSLSDIANRLEISMNAAKYHIVNLTKAGVLEISRTRYSVKGKKVKIYQVKSQVFLVSPTVTSADQLKKAVMKHRAEIGEPVRIILKWDKSGKITYFNESGHRFFGFDHHEVIGKPLVGTIVPDKESGSERDLEYMIENILTHPENHQANENENITKDGTRVWIRWSNKPIYDKKGELIGMFSIGTDMTEHKAEEESIFRADNDTLT
ncbi:putative transcriptional regulator [Methanoregula boonei 6A8]|uniref:Putative transcriptional regulator n=1 Tax=Methanoregula boonei (strain DSM 21154 / JCM 14090 / 6A8) TaxID=456442 RepID=A7I8K5_METB6|nr:PAS domain S-box protein [Methanoregula boonei]ABS56066.1 putative transcriptional regulator [Methanoregula boonei 6A8]